MSDVVNIAPYRPEYFERLMELEIAAFNEPHTAKQLELLLKSPSQAWVVMHQHQIEGFAIGRVIVDESELLDIVVAEHLRGQGVAEQLLQQLIAQCSELGATIMHLEVRESNASAISFYQRMGFMDQGFRKDYYLNSDGTRENARLMAFRLSSRL